MTGRIVWLVVCLLLAFVVNQVRSGRSLADVGGLIGGAVGDPDARAAGLLAAPTHPDVPADVWLARYGHSTRGTATSLVVGACRAARAAGAVRVEIGEVIEADAQHAVTTEIVIELPGDPARRDAVLRAFVRGVGRSGEPESVFDGIGSRYAIFDTR